MSYILHLFWFYKGKYWTVPFSLNFLYFDSTIIFRPLISLSVKTKDQVKTDVIFTSVEIPRLKYRNKLKNPQNST